MHKIGVIGTGFVGTAVSTGLETVLGDKVEIREYDKYKDTESIDSVVNNSSILFVCVPTPMADSGACDTSIIRSAVDDIVKVAEHSKVIVIKSTVPPGTTNELQQLYPKHSFVFNPEFLTEKNFITDFINQDRIILGTPEDFDHNKNVLKVHKLFEDFVSMQQTPGTIFDTTPEVAEMVKYIGNCFLATKVSFFNEMYDICVAAGVDFDQAAALACTDRRIGASHSKVPGPDGDRGFGLSCFPKDINALRAFAESLGCDTMMLETVWTKNLMVRQKYDWEELPQVTGEYKKR